MYVYFSLLEDSFLRVEFFFSTLLFPTRPKKMLF